MFAYHLFAITIFLSAFLLFQVQPIISKYILPWFGGASFVWIVSLLFFQTLLLAGYLYSYLVTKLTLRKQIFIHICIIAIGLSIIFILFKIWPSPLTPEISSKLPDNFPATWQVLQVLTISVGFPYFILSVTSTLLQKWFSNLSPQRTPYTLYSVSNAGSLLGIATYPFLFEPLFTVHAQAIIWTASFIALCILLMLSTLLTLRKSKSAKHNATPNVRAGYRVNFHQSILWLLLPAASSILLLSTTNQLTQTVAPIPFLWLVPLGLYLVSFILCFHDKHRYAGRIYAYIFLILIPVMFVLLLSAATIGLIPEIFLYSCLLFSGFMLCHGELYLKRPEAENLNIFYLLIALGSAIGSSIVAIVAPVLFKGLSWEFILGLITVSLIATQALRNDEKSILNKLNFLSQKEISIFMTCLFCAFFLVMSLQNFVSQTYGSIGIWRNFYGIIRISEEKVKHGTTLCLMNGKIIHGCQYKSTTLSKQPTTYYGEKGGMGFAIKNLRKNKRSLRIGVVGLGAGTTAAYGKKGDYIRFYELNPLDVELAQKYFTYLKDSEAKIDVVIGDGRLSLEKELRENKTQQFDILIIDAFTDDSVPVHLLTREAFDIYRKHLSPSGIIAFHISTRYINLQAPMIKAADHLQMSIAIVQTPGDDKLNTASRWALLSHDKKLLNTPEIIKAKMDISKLPKISLWTDDYSNILQIVQY